MQLKQPHQQALLTLSYEKHQRARVQLSHQNHALSLSSMHGTADLSQNNVQLGPLSNNGSTCPPPPQANAAQQAAHYSPDPCPSAAVPQQHPPHSRSAPQLLRLNRAVVLLQPGGNVRPHLCRRSAGGGGKCAPRQSARGLTFQACGLRPVTSGCAAAHLLAHCGRRLCQNAHSAAAGRARGQT